MLQFYITKLSHKAIKLIREQENKLNSQGYFVVNSDLTQEKESYAFAFNKKNKKLARLFDIELRNLEENGKIDILKLRWFSSYGIYANILK